MVCFNGTLEDAVSFYATNSWHKNLFDMDKVLSDTGVNLLNEANKLEKTKVM